MNSVIIHTLNDKGHTAPIVFVGTRGDVVTSPAQHASISTLFSSTFCTSMAWPHVLENKDTQGSNGTANLCFFPVNNRLGRADGNLVRLLLVIEERIDASDYVHEDSACETGHKSSRTSSRYSDRQAAEAIPLLTGTVLAGSTR